MREVLKKIFFELVAIRKELQAIRSCLESKKVSMDVNVNASRDICTFYGVMDPADVPSIMFSVGEKQIIQDAISEINDIKAAQNVLKMAKNS